MAKFADQITYEPLGVLHPDPRNPRIPPRRLPSRVSDAWLFRYIARHHDALTVAESIAEFGYFPSEPLVVITDENRLVVAEGNRRLTALRGLTDAKLRSSFANRARWNTAAKRAGLRASVTVPVIMANSREDVAPLIGYRHVAGIQKWDAYPRARFVSQMIDIDRHSFDDVAERVGLSASQTRSMYRNHAILRQAAEAFKLDIERPEERFGVFTAAMNRVAIRDYVDAPPAKAVQPIYQNGSGPHWLLPSDSKKALRRLFGWLYGDDDLEPVIEDSRDLRRLAEVLKEPDGRAELEKSRRLELAEAAIGLQTARLVERIQRARFALEAAVSDAANASDTAEPLELAAECRSLIERLIEILSNSEK